MPQSWLLLANKREPRLKNFQSFCIEKESNKWNLCFHSRHIQETQYTIEYVCRTLNTLYDEHIYLQKEIGIGEPDPTRPSIIEFLDLLSRDKTAEKIKEQLERFNLRINQLGEIKEKVGKLEIKLDYLKEKQYLIDIEKKLVRTENLTNFISQQAAELKETQENLKNLLETLISRIG